MGCFVHGLTERPDGTLEPTVRYRDTSDPEQMVLPRMSHGIFDDGEYDGAEEIGDGADCDGEGLL